MFILISCLCDVYILLLIWYCRLSYLALFACDSMNCCIVLLVLCVDLIGMLICVLLRLLLLDSGCCGESLLLCFEQDGYFEGVFVD